MFFRIIRNDIARSKLISLTTLIFTAAAAMLVSLSAILIVNLTGAIDTMMKQAKTPHYLQMHAGELNTVRLSDFAKNSSYVDEYQALEFLNVDGAQIHINDQSLAGSVQDNGLSTQSEHFDYLLDLNGNIIEASDGEIYVPVAYMKDGTAKLGDKLTIHDQEWTVVGFLRDSQMNSLLASSKRFLVSTNDYAAAKSSGNIEYLIEFRLKDLSDLSAFEAAYTSAGLEANGPTITYPLFKMLNAISDGLMIAVILLISVLVVAINFLCIRFTLLAKIEDDYREIGVMKAIGLRLKDIKKIYLAKYSLLTAVGCLLGFGLSFLFRDAMLANIRLYMGESENSSSALLFGILGILLVFLAIQAYVSSVLRRFRSISAAEAIRFGTAQGRAAGAKQFVLSRNKLLPTNVFLGLKDVLGRKRLYTTMLAVLVIAVFIIIVPQNLHNTISSKSFITYMGIGDSDIRMDIQQMDDLPATAAEIIHMLEQDEVISRSALLMTKSFDVKTDNGTVERIKIELGDHSVFPVTYSKGSAPTADDEIALSAIQADELGKKIGDPLILLIANEERKLTVSGIYSDITNGGKTAKAVFSDASTDIMWCIIYAELTDPALVQTKIAEYSDSFNTAKISSIDEFVEQTFGTTISSVKQASYAAILIAVALSVLVTLLFMRMLVSKDRYDIAVMKSIGFSNSDITVQYVWRAVFVLMVSIVLGLLLANTLGEMLAGAVISSFGVTSFHFVTDPLSSYIFVPLLMTGAVLLAAILGTTRAGQLQLSEHLKE